jgi:hypothetical protein
VENDLRVMKIKRWRKKAQNRAEWASVIKEAKVLKGPQSQRASKKQSIFTPARLMAYYILTRFNSSEPNCRWSCASL